MVSLRPGPSLLQVPSPSCCGVMEGPGLSLGGKAWEAQEPTGLCTEQPKGAPE